MQKTLERLSVIELELESFVEGEIGEPVEIKTPVGTVTATWLGSVGTDENGKALPGCLTLTEACKLMCAISDERKAARRDNGK